MTATQAHFRSAGRPAAASEHAPRPPNALKKRYQTRIDTHDPHLAAAPSILIWGI